MKDLNKVRLEEKKSLHPYEKFVAKLESDNMVDLQYWYMIIVERSVKKDLLKISKHEKILELVYGHCEEYENRLSSEDGDVFNEGKKYDDGEKKLFIATRIYAFGFIYDALHDLNSDIVKLTGVEGLEPINSQLTHAKGALYGAIKYAKKINYCDEDIKRLYSNFEKNNELIEGLNPWIRIEELAKNSTNEKTEIIDKKINAFVRSLTKNDDGTLSVSSNSIKSNELNDKAYEYFDKNEYQLGINLALKAIKLSPNSAGFYDTVGLGYFNLGEFKLATEYISKAIDLDPDGLRSNAAEHYLNRGKALVGLTLINEARCDFKKVLNRFNDESAKEEAKRIIELLN